MSAAPIFGLVLATISTLIGLGLFAGAVYRHYRPRWDEAGSITLTFVGLCFFLPGAPPLALWLWSGFQG